MSEKILPSYLKLGLVKENVVEKSSSSLSSISPYLNAVVSPPLSTVTSAAISSLPISVASQKVSKTSNMKKSYVQASKMNILSNVEDVLQVKEVFPSLLADEVGRILKAKNSSESKKKPKLNMMTREPSRKEVIVPMTKSNAELIMKSAHTHITNINKYLKNSKSDIITDFIHISNNGIIITMNHPANILDLSTIKNFLKNIDNINLDSIEGPHLLKSKSFIKIIGLPYNSELGVITPDFIEGVLKETHLFKDVALALKPYVIKAFPKSDMAVVWVDIWDSQSSSLAKNIINHHFNIG